MRRGNPHGYEQRVVPFRHGYGVRLIWDRYDVETKRSDEIYALDYIIGSSGESFGFIRDSSDATIQVPFSVENGTPRLSPADAKKLTMHDVVVLGEMFKALRAHYARLTNPRPGHGEHVDASTNARIERELRGPNVVTYGRRRNPAESRISRVRFHPWSSDRGWFQFWADGEEWRLEMHYGFDENLQKAVGITIFRGSDWSPWRASPPDNAGLFVWDGKTVRPYGQPRGGIGLLLFTTEVVEHLKQTQEKSIRRMTLIRPFFYPTKKRVRRAT